MRRRIQLAGTSKDRVHAIAVQVLGENPDGVRFAALTREISGRDPSLNVETIKYYTWDLHVRYPDKVCKPARGVFQLVSPAEPPTGQPEPLGPSSAAAEPSRTAGVNKETFVFGRDGRPVAVLLPIEDYERLLRGQRGGRPGGARPSRGATRDVTSPSLIAGRASRRSPGVPDAQALADHIRSLEGFAFVQPAPPHGHMGATMVDSILQRGMNYDAVVLPRVHRLRNEHPEAATTSGFAELMRQEELSSLIDFRGEYVLATVRELTEVLRAANVETEDDLRAWLDDAANRQRLAQIKGIGPKTGEFIRLRCGARDAVAVDRWLIRMLEEAGVHARGFWDQHEVISDAAELLDVSPADLEESIWAYMSKRPGQSG